MKIYIGSDHAGFELKRTLMSYLREEKYEVIVADGDSTDSTRQIAKRFGCRIIIGMKHAEGINNGAKAAKGDVLLFLDADTILPQHFLRLNYNDFLKKGPDIATCYPSSIPATNIADEIINVLSNAFVSLSNRIKPYVPGFCFMVTKKKFFELGGFDESIPWFDDLAFSNKLPKNTAFAMLPVNIKVSVRRAEKVGRLRLCLVHLKLAFYRLLGKNYTGLY